MYSKDFRQQAWSSLKGKWGSAILVLLVYFVISGVSSYVPALPLIIGGFLTVGVSIAMLKLIRGGKPEVSDLFKATDRFVEVMLLHILNSLFIALWTLLFIIPGIIKSYSYSMSYYIMADDPKISQSDARKLSSKMMDGNKWRLFCLDFSFIGWHLLATLTCGILYIWVLPYIEAAHAAFYEEIKKPFVVAPVVEENTVDFVPEAVEEVTNVEE